VVWGGRDDRLPQHDHARLDPDQENAAPAARQEGEVMRYFLFMAACLSVGFIVGWTEAQEACGR
jgi:hypothetical protein